MPHERRIYLDLKDGSGGVATIENLIQITKNYSPETHHYLTKVLRLKISDEVIVVSKLTEYEYKTSISSTSSDIVELQVLSSTKNPRSNTNELTLLFALCKGDTNDLVCEKATELGTTKIVIWKAERSIPVIQEKSLSNKLTRWNKIIESACAQSSRSSIPKLVYATSLVEALKLLQTCDSCFYCSLEDGAMSLTDAMQETSQSATYCIVIGPEGDFTANEVALLKTKYFKPVSLGKNRLRSETAAIAALAVVAIAQYSPKN